MEVQNLEANTRDTFGKGPARRTRMAGLVPGIVYGSSTEPKSVSVDPKAFRAALSGPFGVNAVIKLAVADGSEFEVMVKHYQKDATGRKIMHADFVVVDHEVPVTVEVPLALVGKAAGVAAGGKIRQVRRSCHVKCVPGRIPVRLEYDVSALGIKERALASQIVPPEGVELVLKSDFAIASISAPRVAREVVEAE